MFAGRWLIVLGVVSLATEAESAIFKCPDGQFQDQPCAKGSVEDSSKLRPDATKLRPPDEACGAVGKEAARIARARSDGGSASKMLADAEAQDVPFARKQTQKNLITKVFNSTGTPTEIAARIEAECVRSRKQSAPKKK